jgi:hypothetical protein
MTKIWPRRRNLWITDTLQWAPEARLAQPANAMWVARLQLCLHVGQVQSRSLFWIGQHATLLFS